MPDSIIKDLLKGKYIPINKLIRQPQEAASTDPHVITQLDSQHAITKLGRSKTRTVTEHIDWFEAYVSSVLPAQTRLVRQATTVAAAHSAANAVQNHLCFVLAAVRMFRDHDVPTALRYLESHREECHRQSTNIAEPNLLKLVNTSLGSHGVAAARQHHVVARHGGGSSSSSSSSSSSAAARPKLPADGTCGRYNSWNGCSTDKCPYRHSCRTCKSEAHGQTACPTWQQQRDKGSNASSPAVKSRK